MGPNVRSAHHAVGGIAGRGVGPAGDANAGESDTGIVSGGEVELGRRGDLAGAGHALDARRSRGAIAVREKHA